MYTVNTYLSVSYTHLDVYKRQGESQPNRFGPPNGQVVVTKQMARELGLIDTTPSMGLTAGLFCAIFVLWFLVDKLLMTSAM